MKLHSYRIVLLLGSPLAASAEPTTTVASEMHAAADHPDAETHFQLARKLLAGDGVPKDEKKAFNLMKAAADRGHADAIGGVGYFYNTGLVVDKDEKVAVEWFRKGAEKGSAKAQLNLGKMLIKNRTTSIVTSDGENSYEKSRIEGLEWIKKSANSGLPEGALAYGSTLYFGDHDVVKDFDKAFLYLKTAAEGGLPVAQNLLGNMYELGIGVQQDNAQATQWFRKAAIQGNIKAQGCLGRLLGPESENREPRIESLAWLIIASEQGDVASNKIMEGQSTVTNEGDRDAARRKAEEMKKEVRTR